MLGEWCFFPLDGWAGASEARDAEDAPCQLAGRSGWYSPGRNTLLSLELFDAVDPSRADGQLQLQESGAALVPWSRDGLWDGVPGTPGHFPALPLHP